LQSREVVHLQSILTSLFTTFTFNHHNQFSNVSNQLIHKLFTQIKLKHTKQTIKQISQTNKQTNKRREKQINHKLNSPPISFEFVDNVSNGVVLCVSVSVCVCMCVSIESEYMCVY
jgi:hypothetical protein